MNIENFAQSLLDQCEELRNLRMRNTWLEKELLKYQNHIQDSNEAYEGMFCGLLSSALDPDSAMNKHQRDKL